jgi:hypothetical protein
MFSKIYRHPRTVVEVDIKQEEGGRGVMVLDKGAEDAVDLEVPVKV